MQDPVCCITLKGVVWFQPFLECCNQ